MNSEFERQAKWHATKVILVLLGIIGLFMGLTYINILYTFIAVALFFIIMVASALYTDAYYTKLIELERNGRKNT